MVRNIILEQKNIKKEQERLIKENMARIIIHKLKNTEKELKLLV